MRQEADAAMTYSDREILRRTDFAKMTLPRKKKPTRRAIARVLPC